MHEDLDAVRSELYALRRGLDEAAAEIGCGILPVGTHPWSSWQDQQVEDDAGPVPRDGGPVPARSPAQQVICGCHVHVGIGDPELVVDVMTRVRPWTPVLLALAANSPFWNGEDTGYDSYRLEIWARWPTAGMPPRAGRPGRLRRGRRPSSGPPTPSRTPPICTGTSALRPVPDPRVPGHRRLPGRSTPRRAVAGLARGLARRPCAEAAAAAPLADAIAAAAGRRLLAGRPLRPGRRARVARHRAARRRPPTSWSRAAGRVGHALDELGDRDEVTRLVEAIVGTATAPVASGRRGPNGGTRRRRGHGSGPAPGDGRGD